MSDMDLNFLEADVSPSIAENIYCIYLNIIEGLGFLSKDFEKEEGTEKVVLVKASLNGVLFEVVGNIAPENSVIFNNNCIWECDLDDIKKIKSDNRPIRLDCFLKSSYTTKTRIKQIGTLLLPLRSIKIIHNLSKLQIKPIWHTLHNLSFKWRNKRPQIFLVLVIVRKTIVNNVQMATNLDTHKMLSVEDSNSRGYLCSNVSQTLHMLQSQDNIHVQLLEECGQIQVGSDPHVDCDIFCLTITFKNIRNVSTLFDFVPKLSKIQNNSFIFQYDFLGSISNVEIIINSNDCYTLNQKISLNFRSSLESLRLYLKKIFYIPIYLYYSSQNVAIASYRLEISQFLPNDCYFDDETSEVWTKNETFVLNRLNNVLSNTKTLKSSIEFMITLELLTKNVRKNQCGFITFHDQNKHLLTHSEASPDVTEIENDVAYTQANTQYLQRENSFSRKAKIKGAHLKSSVKPQTNIFENASSNTFLGDTCNVGVNTERISESDKFLLKFIQDLDNWKQEIEGFVRGLVSTKQLYLQEFLSRCETQISRVETKIIKCEKLNALLEEIQTKWKNIQITGNNLREVELKHINMLTTLEMKMKDLLLKAEENEKETTALRKRVDCLEKKLALFKHSMLPMDQLEDILNDMHQQTKRFAAIENIYKEKWDNIKYETNELKLKLQKHESTQLKNSKVNPRFEEILNEKKLKTYLTDDIMF